MRLIKIVTILALMTFLNSCRKVPSLKPLVQCDISFAYDRCRCRCYNLMSAKTVAPENCNIEDVVGSAWNAPIEDCENFAGFHAKDWALHIIPYLKSAKGRIDQAEENEQKMFEEFLKRTK